MKPDQNTPPKESDAHNHEAKGGCQQDACSPVLEWLINGQTGLSSRCMAAVALGVTPKEIYYPLDPSDLNRCLLLIEAAPAVKESFPKIAQLCPEWESLIGMWDDLETAFLEEAGLNWSKDFKSPTCYKMMEAAINQANK